MKIFGRSDKGIERVRNEDNLYYRTYNNDFALVAVADGMGGHAAGEVASRIAVESLSDFLPVFDDNEEPIDYDAVDLSDKVADIIRSINRNIYLESKVDRSKNGMGTTLTMGLINGQRAVIGHVGDSRVYHLSGKLMQKVTSDHTVVAEMLKDGRITREEMSNHPRRHMLTRALGTSATVEIDLESVSLEKGDILLFCTDGLTSLVNEEEIKQVITDKAGDPKKAVEFLIALANNRGGFDNITIVIVADIGEVDAQ